MEIKVGENSAPPSTVSIINAKPDWSDGDLEVIERKGLGHPDTIADALACLLSRNYSRLTMEQCGFILHHQFDKVMVIGGKTQVSWGKGEFIEPVRVVVAGRATSSFENRSLPVEDLIVSTVREFFKVNFHFPDIDKNLTIDIFVSTAPGPGALTESSGAIASMFNPRSAADVRGYGSHYVSNDTSCCVGYAPHSRLELAIRDLEATLNFSTTRKKWPWLGNDIKIMAVRIKDTVDITMCVPQISEFVESPTAYAKNLAAIAEFIEHTLANSLAIYQVRVYINTKDKKSDNNYYISLTGSSLNGDIGVVGRGNRVNGLITFCRPMSLEGASGKNPRYYSGFIYSIACQRIAQAVYENSGQAAELFIVSQNGAPLLSPWHIAAKTLTFDEAKTAEIIRNGLEDIPLISADFIDGKIITY